MLRINYKKGKYELEGSLILENATSLLSHIELLLQNHSTIVISLKKLQKIDHSGVEALLQLHSKAIQHRKILKVLGEVHKNITWILTDTKFKKVINT